MAMLGQTQAPNAGADSRSAGFPPHPQPHPSPTTIHDSNVHCSATPQREAAPATMARRGQSQATDPGADPRSAGFPPTPSPIPHPPISPVSPPSRTSQSTLFLALLFKCRLRVCLKKIPLTQEMGYWGRTGFCINSNGGGRQCPSCALAWAHSCPAKFFLSWWRGSGCLHIGTPIFFYQKGQFIMCQGPLWAKFDAEYRFRQSQGVHTGCSS